MKKFTFLAFAFTLLSAHDSDAQQHYQASHTTDNVSYSHCKRKKPSGRISATAKFFTIASLTNQNSLIKDSDHTD